MADRNTQTVINVLGKIAANISEEPQEEEEQENEQSLFGD